MWTRTQVGVVIAILCAVLVSGCRLTTPEAPGAETQIGLANPSALYCEEQEGEYEIVSGADGSQEGVCRFGEGSECEGWSFYRGECGPESSEEAPAVAQPTAIEVAAAQAEVVQPDGEGPAGDEGEGIAGMANPASLYCREQSGRLEIRSDEEGNQIGICIFADGSECEEWTYFLSECGPGANIDPQVQAPRLIYGWYGLVVAAGDEEFEGYTLSLLPDSAATVELVTMDEDVKGALAVSVEGSAPIHVWGLLTCDLNTPCWLEATQVLSDGDPKTLSPDPVQGWQGTLETLPPMAQFDDVFILSDPNFPVRYGIHAPDVNVAAALDTLRDTHRIFRVFGELTCNLTDVNGCQIRADWIEVMP
jgi:putative hemolysin